MELRFRPDDTYCKPTCGTRAESSSLLVKVKRVRVTRKCKRTGKTMEPKEEIRTEVLAPIQTTFTIFSTFQPKRQRIWNPERPM